jgi:hypothetical protein
MATQVTVENGIDVDQLVHMIDAIEADSSVRPFTFRATSSWNDGTHNAGRIGSFTHARAEYSSRTRPFELEGDEPPVLLGSNQDPNAVELLLQAPGRARAVSAPVDRHHLDGLADPLQVQGASGVPRDETGRFDQCHRGEHLI